MTHNFKSITVLRAVNEAAFCFNTAGKKIKIPPLCKKKHVLIRQGSRHPLTPLQLRPCDSFKYCQFQEN